MITHQLSAKAYIVNCGYNGEIHRCANERCNNVAYGGHNLCLACRQEAERRNPRQRRQSGRVCADCGVPIPGTHRRYCDDCAAAREKANVRAVKARQRQRRKGAL